jgi:hypothetical protein
MNTPVIADYEIVGFESPKTSDIDKCTLSTRLPICREIGTNCFFILGNDNQRHFLMGEQFKDYCDENQITTLSNPVPSFQSPIVIWITKIAYKELYSLYGDEFTSHTFQELSDVFVLIINEDEATKLQNGWALKLEEQSRLDLTNFFTNGDNEIKFHALELSKLALSAAHDHQLRKKVYITYGLCLLKNLGVQSFQNVSRLIVRSIPELTLEVLTEETSKLEGQLKQNDKK